jgi:hypothetical protein
MAITSPALTLAVEALFGHIRPAVARLNKLGVTDFSDGAPGAEIKPGTTIKVPVSSVAAASEYNQETNNYLTGGLTSWATLTATHYLQGFDIKGTDVDNGVNAPKMKQLFSRRAGGGIVSAVNAIVAAALDGATASTGVTLPAAPTIEQYSGLAGAIAWLDKASSVLAINGTEAGLIKGAFFNKGVSGDLSQLAQYMGFADAQVIPGMTARCCIVPPSSMGFIGRVPAILARYAQAGAETDPDSGIAIGIVLADDQALNRQIVNADLWFGGTVLSANAGATTAGVVKVGTSQ